MSLNPFRMRLQPMQPNTPDQFRHFRHIPTEQEVPTPKQLEKAERRRERERRLEADSCDFSFSSDSDSSSHSDSDLSSLSDQRSERNPLQRGRFPQRSDRSLSRSGRPKRKRYPIPPCQDVSYLREIRGDPLPEAQITYTEEVSDSTAKWLLAWQYINTAAFRPSTMTSTPALLSQFSSQEYLDSHSYAELQNQVDALRIPNAPTWQEEVNEQQATGLTDYPCTQAEMWDMEQHIKRTIELQEQVAMRQAEAREWFLIQHGDLSDLVPSLHMVRME